MPHAIVKLYAGRSEEQKQRIADAVAKAIMESAGSSDDAVSVSIEDVSKEDWAEAVYRPDIVAKPGALYKKPGYNPFT
jgi:4-oxalocrotonate tautomerase